MYGITVTVRPNSTETEDLDRKLICCGLIATINRYNRPEVQRESRTTYTRTYIQRRTAKRRERMLSVVVQARTNGGEQINLRERTRDRSLETILSVLVFSLIKEAS